MLSGARSEVVENVRRIAGRRDCGNLGGEEDIIPVEEVGTGVGYLCFSLRNFNGEYFFGEQRVGELLRTRFAGLGSGGDDEYGSNAGRRVGIGADRLTPTIDCIAPPDLLAEGVIVPAMCLRQRREEYGCLGALWKGSQ